MTNTAFIGSITTVGTSQAIRLENALFRSFPEFHQKAKVRANVISPGQMLISVVDEATAPESDDPVVEAFLGFLAKDMQSNPKRIGPLSQAATSRARKLTKNIVVDDNEILPDDITF